MKNINTLSGKDEEYIISQYGNKANGLIEISKLNLNLPETYFLSVDDLKYLIYFKFIGNPYYITDILDKNKKYIIRSSGISSMAGILDSVVVDGESIKSGIFKVIDSWDSDLAKKYRKFKKMSDDINMGIVIQEFVDYDLGGIANSVDIINGNNIINGQFVKENLSDLCSGEIDGKDIKEMDYGLLDQLTKAIILLEDKNTYPVEVEFVVKNNVLMIVQVRDAHLTDKAFFTLYKNFGKFLDYSKYYDIENCNTFEVKNKKSFICNANYESGFEYFFGILTHNKDIDSKYKHILLLDDINLKDLDIDNLKQFAGILLKRLPSYSHIADLFRANKINCYSYNGRKQPKIRENKKITVSYQIYAGIQEGIVINPFIKKLANL